MSKIIIHNDSRLSDDMILSLVSNIIREGRISNGGYCYVSVWEFDDFKLTITATKNEKSDTFRAWSKDND